jgi:hypothetical protein
MSRSGKSKINKIKFHSVVRDIKAAKVAGTYNTKTIATAQHISPETVNAIRRAKTWPGFLLAKQNYNTLRLRGKAAQFEAHQRAVAVPTIAPAMSDEQFESDLKAITEAPVTRLHINMLGDALRLEMRLLRRRVENLENARVPKRSLFGRKR